MGERSSQTDTDNEFLKYDEGLVLKLVQTKEDAIELALELAKYDVIAIDFETNSKHIKDPAFRDVGISFAVDRTRAWYIPYDHEEPAQLSLFAPPLKQLSRQFVMRTFRFVWETKKIIGHNLKYEVQVLRRNNERVYHYKQSPKGGGTYFDTWIAQKVLDDRMLSYSLKGLCRHYFKRRSLTLNQVLGKGQRDFTQVALDIALNYAAPDSCNCFALYEVLKEQLDKNTPFARSTSNIFWNYEMPLIDIVAEMEHVGFQLDTEHLLEVERQSTKECEIREEVMRDFLYKRCPDFDEQFGTFAPSADARVKDALFEVYDVPTPHAKFGKQEVDRQALESIKDAIENDERWMNKNPGAQEFVQAMLEWRKEDKVRSTYTSNLIEKRVNGILYPEFNQMGTKSGRGSSNNPNGQNLPGSGDKYHIRKALLPPGRDLVWVVADYRNLEIYITAALSQCPVLKPMVCGDITIFDKLAVDIIDPKRHYDEKVRELIEEDNLSEAKALEMAKMLDMHRYTAAKAFNVPYDKVSKKQRKDAKPVNFGIIYGISEHGLANRLRVSKAQALVLINGFYKAYPGVARWIEENNKIIFDEKMIATEQGRYRLVPHWALDMDESAYNGIRRWCTNHKVQGTGGYITKKAMIDIALELRKRPELRARQAFQIHDEIIVAVHREDVKKVGELMVKLMNTELHGVPIIVDGFQIMETLDKG